MGQIKNIKLHIVTDIKSDYSRNLTHQVCEYTTFAWIHFPHWGPTRCQDHYFHENNGRSKFFEGGSEEEVWKGRR